MNLVLGTAALGFPYGVCNREEKLGQKEVTKIIEKAWECGIREFDTAQAYQDSEVFLGQAFKELGIGDETKVITKLHAEISPRNLGQILMTLNNSLYRLKLDILEGILFHREWVLDFYDFYDVDFLNEILWNLKQTGKVKKIGVSVYHPEYAIQALNINEMDIVQFPGNVFDRRFERLGVFELAKKKGKEIYLRNIFLQGMLLADPENLPPNMEFMKFEIVRLRSMAVQFGLTRQELAINYLKTFFPEAKLIFGVETPEQVQGNVDVWKKPFSAEMDWVQRIFFNVSDRILIPKLWRLMG